MGKKGSSKVKSKSRSKSRKSKSKVKDTLIEKKVIKTETTFVPVDISKNHIIVDIYPKSDKMKPHRIDINLKTYEILVDGKKFADLSLIESDPKLIKNSSKLKEPQVYSHWQTARNTVSASGLALFSGTEYTVKWILECVLIVLNLLDYGIFTLPFIGFILSFPFPKTTSYLGHGLVSVLTQSSSVLKNMFNDIISGL